MKVHESHKLKQNGLAKVVLALVIMLGLGLWLYQPAIQERPRLEDAPTEAKAARFTNHMCVKVFSVRKSGIELKPETLREIAQSVAKGAFLSSGEIVYNSDVSAWTGDQAEETPLVKFARPDGSTVVLTKYRVLYGPEALEALEGPVEWIAVQSDP